MTIEQFIRGENVRMSIFRHQKNEPNSRGSLGSTKKWRSQKWIMD